MRWTASMTAGVAIAFALTSCTVGDPGESGPVVGAHGRLTFELLNASPVEEGYITLRVKVQRVDTSLMVEDADVSLQLLMPSMGHESRPDASEMGSGVYHVPDALVDMPGAWVLRVRVTGDESDEAELYFDAL